MPVNRIEAGAPMKRRAFTLVEILAVVAIIALLMGVLLPAIGGVRARARATVSMSNLRQWGVGYGSFSADRKGLLPWEGLKDAADMPTNLADRQRFWANVVPPLLDQPAYADTAAPDGAVPTPNSGQSIFIDPAAPTPSDPLGGTFKGWSVPNTKVKFYFCYVPNSQLNNTLETRMDALPSEDPRSLANKIDPTTRKLSGEWLDARRIRLTHCKQPANTVTMIELRSTPDELDGMGTVNGRAPKYWFPFYGEQLNRHRGDWQRLAARHKNGGHVLMADGHVEWRDQAQATTPAGASGPSKDKTLDFNRPDTIWDPLGPAKME